MHVWQTPELSQGLPLELALVAEVDALEVLAELVLEEALDALVVLDEALVEVLLAEEALVDVLVLESEPPAPPPPSSSSP
ncbi:MAG: hypothetical protein HY744_02365 [Deltaproteobacteria bacterium]|nr:hypothetical protein [Deltaproteobacteria bacterium]